MKAGVRLSEPLQSELSDPLYRDPDFAELYDYDNDGRTDLKFCAAFADVAGSVLDLGCGTGVFLTKLDDRLHRAGVDPAEAMIEIARRRPGGEKVEWYAADARAVRLGCKFDLVVMTGHAFQVFLTEEAQFDVLSTIAEHLSENGRFIFDTRNPAAREWLNWNPKASKRQFTHPVWGVVHAWNDVEMDDKTGIANYETAYEFANSGRVLSARSLIRFTEKARVCEMLRDAGLVVENWLGEWTGEPFRTGSTEIIPIGKLASSVSSFVSQRGFRSVIAARSVECDLVIAKIDVAGLTDVDSDRIIKNFLATLTQPADPENLVATAGISMKSRNHRVPGFYILLQPVRTPAGTVIGVKADHSVFGSVIVNLKKAFRSGTLGKGWLSDKAEQSNKNNNYRPFHLSTPYCAEDPLPSFRVEIPAVVNREGVLSWSAEIVNRHFAELENMEKSRIGNRNF